jgi:transcriptional regulator with XRE-family HTH domain
MALFADLIRQRRKDLHLSQEAVAAAAFDNPDRKTFVSALENNRRQNITLETALKIANTLEIAMEDLPASFQPSQIAPGIAPQTKAKVTPADIARAFNTQLLAELERSVLEGYNTKLDRGLRGLHRWTGAPFSMRSLIVSFALTYFYIVYTGLMGFAAGGGSIGNVVPFLRPAWATGNVPNVALAAVASIVLLISGYWAYRLARPPTTAGMSFVLQFARVIGGACVSGAGCAIASIFGAEPLAVALSVALFAFAAVSAWPPQVAAVAAILGAFIAGFGNAISHEGGFSFDLAGFTVFGGLLGAVAGGVSSLIARRIQGVGPAALAGSGGAIVVGSIGAALALAFTHQSSASTLRGEGILVLMWVVLPISNAISDYLSMGVSHSLARYVRQAEMTWARIIVMSLIDILAAIFLLFVTLTLILWGLNAAEHLYGIDLLSSGFIDAAASDPWGEGLWLSLMLVTTLTWSYLHLAFVVAPIVSAKIVGDLVDASAYKRLHDKGQPNTIDTMSAGFVFIRKSVFVAFWGLLAALPVGLAFCLIPNLLHQMQ